MHAQCQGRQYHSVNNREQSLCMSASEILQCIVAAVSMFIFFSQGCWRKVTVDDLLPFTEQPSHSTEGAGDTSTSADVSTIGETATQVKYIPLYPRTSNPVELWPAILTKAVLKIAALE